MKGWLTTLFLLQEYEKLITMDGSKLCTTRPPKLVTTDLIYSWCEMLEKGKSDLRLFYILQQLVVMVLLHIKNQVHILLRKDRTILSFSLKLSLFFLCCLSVKVCICTASSTQLKSWKKNEMERLWVLLPNKTRLVKVKKEMIISSSTRYLHTYVCVLSIHCGVLHSGCLLLWIFSSRYSQLVTFQWKTRRTKSHWIGRVGIVIKNEDICKTNLSFLLHIKNAIQVVQL